MLPNIWIFDTYTILMIVGIIVAFILYKLYFKKKKIDKRTTLTLDITLIMTVFIGVVSAILVQAIFDLINGTFNFKEMGMTFYGGLIGGVLAFILLYNLYFKRQCKDFDLMTLLVIAPSSIVFAHAIGRLGCFTAGCCYGIETESIFGVMFPGMHTKVYPTQLFEALFLLLLGLVLFLIAYFKDFKYTFTIYFIAYSIFRFMIEFIRGDDRGSFIPGISPAQAISIFLFLIGLGSIFYFRNNLFRKEVTNK